MDKPKTKRVGFVPVPLKTLDGLLRLPDGTHVSQVIERPGDADKGACTLVLEGPVVMETAEGERIPVLDLHFEAKGECPACEQEIIRMIGAAPKENSKGDKK